MGISESFVKDNPDEFKETTTLYLVRTWTSRYPISAVEAERFNDVSVWFNGRRSARVSKDYWYANSFEDAKVWLVDRLTQKAERAKSRLADAERNLSDARKLTLKDTEES